MSWVGRETGGKYCCSHGHVVQNAIAHAIFGSHPSHVLPGAVPLPSTAFLRPVHLGN
jgi:hypothetical protein